MRQVTVDNGGWARAANWWRAAVVSVALLGSALVIGGPADIARGLAWLQAQVQADGKLQGESATASSAQALCETASTIQRLSGTSPQLAALLANLKPASGDAPTETLACWQHLRQQLGQSTLDTDLEMRRVTGQGYAAYPGMGVSSAIDTGWALSARLQNLGSTDKAGLLAWLQSTQATTGSFATAGRADLLATAAILRGLKEDAGKNTTASAIAAKASQWLMAQRQANGTWADDVGVTSVVFEAVHPYSGANPAIASGVEEYLLSKQQPDGSWAGDTYVTSVALRALALAAVTPVDPLLAAAASVRGVVTLAATGEPLAGVTVQATPASGPVKTAVTNANGEYLVQGITPGSIGVTATLSGFQPLSGQVSLQSGATAVFSPAMFPVGSAPPAGARIKGTVLAFGTNAPLQGVTIQLTGPTSVTVNTDATGDFETPVSSGTYSVSYSLTGYTTQLQQVVLSGGATADVGTVLMRVARTTSSMRGVVSDLDGQPITGAVVAVQGVGSATTTSGGSYSFPELGGLQFNVTVTAAGYATRTFGLTVSQPGDIVQDFKLPSLSSAYLDLGSLVLSPASAGLQSDVIGSAVVSNSGSKEASATASAVVLNPDGTRIASLVAVDAAGDALPVLTLAPGAQQVIRFKWNTGSFAPGSYQVTARLQVPGTPSREEPDGVITASTQAALAISAGAHFIGSVKANPPVLRAGTNTPVKVSALIQNSGNVGLPAQDYKLSVVDTKTGLATHTQTISSAEIAVADLRSLAFADWTPAGGGDFRVEVTAPATPGVVVSTPLYVGDAGSALFTVDKAFVPAGTQTVRGTIKVSGQSVENGTINDDLVVPVREAIIKAVKTADQLAYDHYVNPNLSQGQCFLCHVQTQAVVGGERSLRYTQPVSALRRAVLMSATTQNLLNETSSVAGQLTEGAFVMHRDDPNHYRTTNTTLGLWAASQWHDPAAVNYSRLRMGIFLMKQQAANGAWAVDHPDGAWWRTSAPLVALNVGSLSMLRDTLKTQPPVGKKFTPYVIPGISGGHKRMTMGSDGTLYVHIVGGNLWSVSPAGAVTTLVTDLRVQSAHSLGNGRLLLAADTGVYIREANGTRKTLVSREISDAQPLPDGNFLVTIARQEGMWKLTPEGVMTWFAADPRLLAIGSPVQMPNGNILAFAYGGNRLLRYSATGQLLDLPVPVGPAGMLEGMPYKDGLLLRTGSGLWFFNKDWVVERWSQAGGRGMVILPDGRLLVNQDNDLFTVEDSPVDVARHLTSIETSMSRSANWLVAGSGINANNNIDVAFRLMGLSNLRKYFQGTPRATEFDALIQSLGKTLRDRQQASDGGWKWFQSENRVSDPMVTAMVGVALDALNPSPESAEVRNAVNFLLKNQQKDGTWLSRGDLAGTALLPTTWVEIWLPIMLERLGGIDTDLNVTFPANATMSKADRTPTQVITAANGSSTYVWKLTGVTEASQQVSFDVTLKDMLVDEVRPVAQEASLAFSNSFVVGGTVTASIEVPKVAVGTNLTHTVATDKPVYTESDQATFTSPVSNAGTAPRDAFVRMTVLDSAGQVVEVLPVGATVTVPGAGTVQVTSPWAVNGTLAGTYQLKAELISPAGLTYGTATTTFSVTSSQAQSGLARITTDRVSYGAAQTVQLTSRVSNATSNTPLENVQARTVVTSASGATVFTRTEAIDQLAPTTSRQYGYGLAASGLSAGSYSAKLELVSATGVVLAQSTSNFSVLGADVTGVGLTGKLQATPATLFVGQGTQLSLQATNGSSTSLTNVPLTVRVVDPESGTVIASFTSTVSDWQAGQTQSVSFPWMAVGNHNQTLVAAASAQVGGKEIQLAQANLKILGILYTGSTSVIPEEVEAGSTAALNYAVTNPAPVAGRMVGDLTVQTLSGQQLASWPLDLNIGSNSTFAGNQLYVTGEQQQKLNLVLRQQLGTGTVVLSTSPFSIIDPPVPVDVTTGLKKKARILVLVSCPPGLGTKEDAECVAQRSQAITTYLTGWGYTAKAVSTGEAFLAEMRCGTYNTYWVSGGAMKLEVQTIGELRESVRRGEALWMDGVHDSRNQLLHDVAGVKKLGKLSGSGYTAALAAGGVYEAQNLPTMGQPEKFELTTGVQQGSFAPEAGQQVPVPAVISNDFGSGKSLLFAFDLAAMLTADVVQANGQLAGFVGTSADHAAGGSVTLTVGDVTQLAAQITNRGTRTVSFKAEAQLPVGLVSTSTVPAAQLTPKDDGTTTATWTFTIKEGATQELTWLVRATQAGTFSTPLAIYSLPREGSTAPPKLRASTTIEAEVKGAALLLQEPAAAIDALQPSASSDKTNLVKATQAVNAASSLHASGGYEQAIVQWLAAADALANITSADTTQAKRAVALALEATTDAMCIQRCGSAGCQ